MKGPMFVFLAPLGFDYSKIWFLFIIVNTLIHSLTGLKTTRPREIHNFTQGNGGVLFLFDF